MNYKFLLIGLCCVLGGLASAQSSLPVDDRVRIGKLDNGMTYFIQQNSKPEDRVEIRLALKAGAILEDDDQQGLAHFVEHMAFNGSKNFEKNELVEYLESTGTKFGPDLNAYTSFDETVYMLQARTDDQEHLDKALLIFEDWAAGLTFDHEEIDKERGVVKSEWRSRLSPGQRMANQYYPVLYHGSRYANRLPIGKPEIIDGADYETVKRFYRDWYRPDLMALVIVGDINVDDIEIEVKKRFANLTNPAAPRERTKYDVPSHEETLVSIVTDKEAPFTNARMMIKLPRHTVDDGLSYRESIMHRLYNGMLNERLRALTEQAEPPFSYAYSGYSSNIGDIDAYSVYASTAEGQSLSGLEAAMIEVERVKRHGFTATELERQKIEIMSGLESDVKEYDKVESRRHAMRYVYHFLKANPIPSPAQRLVLHQELMPSISVEEVNAMTKQWLIDKNRVFVLTGPESESNPMPTDEDVLAMVDRVAASDVAPYVDEVSSEPLFDKELVAGEIKDVTVLEDIDAEEWLLSNGARVVVKQTDFQNDEIRMTATSEGGESLYGDADYFSASAASDVIEEAGVADFSNSQLEKMMAGKIVSVSPYIGENYEGMSGECAIKDLETMMQLIHLYFTDPRVDEASFMSYKTKSKNLYKNLLANPDYYFYDYTMRFKFQDSKRRMFPRAENFDKIDYNRAVQIYQERFADAADFTFIFVGSFDKAQLMDYVNTYIASLPSTRSLETYKDVSPKMLDGVHKEAFSLGAAPKTQVQLNFHGPLSYSQSKNYRFNSMIEVLRIKLREALREDKGGVYGVRVSGSARKIPREEYNISISFNADPDQAQDLIAETQRVVKLHQEEGFEEEDVAKVRETQRQSMSKNLKENKYWVRQLERAYEMDLDPNNITMDHMEKMQRDLNQDHLLEDMKTYFDWDSYIEIVMTPGEEEAAPGGK